MNVWQDITEEQRSDYDKICLELDSVITSDVIALKRIWEKWYSTIIAFDNNGASMLFKMLCSKKDYLKEKCLSGEMEEYHKARVKCLSRLVYGRVWKRQIKILSGESDDVAGLLKNLQNRINVYECEMEAFKNMKVRYEIDVFEGGYQLIEIKPGAVDNVLGSFKTLSEAEMEMQEYLTAEMKKNPNEFTF